MLKLLVSLYLVAIAVYAQNLVVETVQGKLGGKIHEEFSNIRAFLGVRFAESPLRWKPTVSLPNQRVWEEIKDATKPGSACTQPYFDLFKIREEDTSEDCLFLNIYAPLNATNLPVMFYVHGGAFWGGAGHQYDGSLLASSGVVVVTINYRLGVLGFFGDSFLQTQFGTTGNWGFLDQIEALKYVNQNIAAFGGDPSQVTIFGQSAGGQSILMHLVSDLTDTKLFKRAIIQSGNINPELSLSKFQANVFAKALRAKMGCLTFDCLLQQDALSLVKGAMSDKLYAIGMYPVIDGAAFKTSISDSLKTGSFKVDKNIIIGNNKDEFALFLCMRLKEENFNDLHLQGLLLALFGTHAPAIKRLYPRERYSSAMRNLIAITSDFIFHCGTRAAANSLEVHGADVFLYNFAANMTFAPCWQSSHIIELMFEFPSIRSDFAPKNYRPTKGEQYVADSMVSYWTNFAKTGNPNGNGVPHWDRYTLDRDNDLNFYWNITSRYNTTKDVCDYWDKQPGLLTIKAILAWLGLV
ncbi:carboxylesterase [Acrasis kona]|uniref:Carboxylic ester hydrolase n=1 Tax=Acrasis kona TaxID=1008807 RepID=A0AAW2YTG5_9EUKA